MQILYYGLTCFKVTTRPGGRSTQEVSLFIDPIEGEDGMRNVYGQADLVFLTSQVAQTKLANIKGDPKIIRLPGEYAYLQTKVLGFEGGDVEANFPGDRVVYLIETEDVKVAHLGTAAHLSKEVLSELSGCDVLMIPVGGGEAFTPQKAAEVARIINPKVILPMYYKLKNSSKGLEEKEAFYGEMAVKDTEVSVKFSFKAKEIAERNMDIIELEPLR